MSVRKSAIVLLLAALAAASGCTTIERNAYFDSEGARMPLSVASDRIGILLRNRAALPNVRSLVASKGLTVARIYEDDVLMIVTRPGLDRQAARRLAREIRQELGPDVVTQAGLVAQTPQTERPAILADEVIVKFRGLGTTEATAALTAIGARILMENPFVKGQYLVAAEDQDTLTLANRLRALPAVEYAYPNFYSVPENHETVPADPQFASQWHHRNGGASGGTVGADARTTFAWDLTHGAASTLITVQELFGFNTAHEDIGSNLRSNPAEAAGAAGVDDDANGFVDDVNGWNFGPCSGAMSLPCGNATVTPVLDTNNDAHATSVTGVAMARLDGTTGAVGSCPDCSWMPSVLSNTGSDFAYSLAVGYAQAQGAAVITNSWGGGGPYPNTTAAVNTAATSGRGGLGTVLFWSAGNNPVDICTGPFQQPLASLGNVIAISSSSNLDRRVTGHGFGNCIALLAPTRWGGQDPTPTGTLGITTTDRTGTAGYNSTNGVVCTSVSLTETADNRYTNCFSGTSSATPLAAGVAGLMLTANSGLTRTQVRNALQDTTDKVEDSTGGYSTASGFSSPASGTATHAFGRINAFEAVRLVAPAPNGKAGVDIFLRDNRLDWGNTDQLSNTLFEPTRGFIPHWRSVDIKVDAPPLLASAPANNAAFEAFPSENALEGVTNRVYVRVRNRGPVTAASVTVKLHWIFAGAGLPNLPGDFWSAFPADSSDTTIVHPLGTQPIASLAYSGASVATTAGDAAQIVSFDFPGPAPVPAAPDPNHFCLFAVIDSPQDRPGPKNVAPTANDFIPDWITPRDNNVTHRNIRVDAAPSGGSDSDTIYVANPFNAPAVAILTVQAPRDVRVDLGGLTPGQQITLAPRERRPLRVTLAGVPRGQRVDVDVIQRTTSGGTTVTGGMTYRFGPEPKERNLTQTFSKPGQGKVRPVEPMDYDRYGKRQ